VSTARGRSLVEQLADLKGNTITSEVEEASKDGNKDINKD
jgi:hypothetical protein